MDAWALMGTGMVAAGHTFRYPMLSLLVITGIYTIGPLHYFYYCSLLFPEKEFSSRSLLHFLPAAVVLVIEIIFHLQPVGIRREIIAEVFARDSYHPFKILIFTGSLFILSYMYRVFREVVAVRNEEEVRRSARAVMAANFLAVMGIIFLSTGLVTARQGILRLGNILVALLLVTIFLAHRRYPEFFQILKREICARRYHNSMLGGIDTESLYHQVLAMMTEERLYRDADLSLQKLADLLSITPHQLSEFFNNRLSMNFPMFINVYRVEEAKRILIDEPEAGILSICYQAGFNSKSSFNTVFKKQTGMTPLQFRRENRQ